jgi:hypothetical protein
MRYFDWEVHYPTPILSETKLVRMGFAFAGGLGYHTTACANQWCVLNHAILVLTVGLEPTLKGF